MKVRKVLSALVATSVLSSTFCVYSGISASAAATYDDYSFYASSDGVYYVDANGNSIELAEGDTVLIDDYFDLCYMSTYVSENSSAGITWKLENDIVASNYTFEFDASSGCVLAYNADGVHEFCIGTGLKGDTVNTDETTDFGYLYTADTVNGNIDFYYEDVAIPNYEYDFVPIGTADMPFKGTFEGNGNTISGLYNVCGLFNYISAAKINDLTIANSYIVADGDENLAAGAFAANADDADLTLCWAEDCYVGTDATNANIGGLVGVFQPTYYNAKDSTILFCQFIGNSVIDNTPAESGTFTGGIIGKVNHYGGVSLTISNCLVTADIYGGSSYTGPWTGSNLNIQVNVNCLNTGVLDAQVAMQDQNPNDENAYTECYILEGNINENNRFFEVTQEYIDNGWVTYMLQSNRDQTGAYWTQNLTDGELPILSKTADYLVYSYNGGYSNNTHDECIYSDNGICSACGGFESPEEISSNRYKITNYGQLCAFAELVNSGQTTINGVLAANIVAEPGYDWVPIEGYAGNFSGTNYTISELSVGDGNDNYAGLFATVSGGKISNVGIIDSFFCADAVGAIAGCLEDGGSITNCYAYNNTLEDSKGSSDDPLKCAGIVAHVNGGTITSACTDFADGAIGYSDGLGATVSGCYHLNSESTYGTCVEQYQLENGYVAYMLWNNCTINNIHSPWGQDLSTEGTMPVLNSKLQVYCNGNSYDNVSPSEHVHSSVTANSNGTHHSYHCDFCGLDINNESCTYVDGFCSVCGNFDVKCDYIVYNEAGAYVLPTPSEVINGPDNLGWIDEAGNLYKCESTVVLEEATKFTKVTIELNTFAASAKLDKNSSGIRFATQLSIVGSDYDTLNLACGTLIVPADYDVDFTYENFVENGYITALYADDEAVFNDVTVDDYTYNNSYFGSIVNLYPFNYGRQFTGCGYAAVTYADGTIEYYYTNNSTTRSVYELATSAYADRAQVADDEYNNETRALDGETVYYSLYNDEQLEILIGFIDGVVDLSVNASSGTVSVNVPDEIVEFYERPYDATLVDDTITVSGDDWYSYVKIVKNGQTLYARRTVLINGQRIIPGDYTYTVPTTYSSAISNSLEIVLN